MFHDDSSLMPENQSLFERASLAWEAGNTEEAKQLFEQGALSGDGSCMVNLGVIYGDESEIEKELYWYNKAWTAGESSAASNIAIANRSRGNLSVAMRWFQKAIKAGDGDAHLELAKTLFEMGKGSEIFKPHLEATIESNNVTQQSVEEARSWLNELTT